MFFSDGWIKIYGTSQSFCFTFEEEVDVWCARWFYYKTATSQCYMGIELVICYGTQRQQSFSFHSRYTSSSEKVVFPVLLSVLQKSLLWIDNLGELAHALRFLASVVSQSFLAFGDILELHRKFLELSGGINRIFELEELLDAAQSGIWKECWHIILIFFTETSFVPSYTYLRVSWDLLLVISRKQFT